MQPFESIKFKHLPAEFDPRSSQIRPASKLPAPRAAPWQHKGPAAGSGGRAVTLKKLSKTHGHAWDGAQTQPPPKRPVLLPAGPKVRVLAATAVSGSPERARSPVATSPQGQGPPPPKGLPSPGRVAAAAACGEAPQSPLAYQLSRRDSSGAPPHAFIAPGEAAGRSGWAFRSPTKPRDDAPVAAAAASAVPPRPEGLNVRELCPAKRAPPDLRSIDLTEAVPDPDDAIVRTPRFLVPPHVEVAQGAGPQSIEGFARNLDDAVHGADQALCYNVWAHSPDVFSETGLPTVDCTGTLFFTPSAHYGGSTLITLTLSDNAAISPRSQEVKTSLPQTFSISVLPAPVPVPRPVDWRSHQRKRHMAVAVIADDAADAAAAAAAAEPAPGPAEERWTFPPPNVHKLRERRRVKGHQSLGLRAVMGACPLERVLAPQLAQDRISLGGGGRIDASPENEQRCRAAVRDREESSGNPYSPELLAGLGTLAGIYFTWGGDHLQQCARCLRRMVDILGVECGIVDGDLSAVPRAASALAGAGLDSDRLRRQSTEARVERVERYAESLLDVARFHLVCGQYTDAARAADEALAVIERVHGAEHAMYVRGCACLAEVRCHDGDAGAALAAARRMLGAAELVYSDGDPALAACRHLHAYCAARAPGGADAQRWVDAHRAALAARRAACGDGPKVAESLLFAADACCVRGHWEEAHGYAEEAVELCQRLLAAPVPAGADRHEHGLAALLLAPALLSLAHVCMLRSRYKGVSGAVTWLEQAVRAAEDTHTAASPFTVHCRAALGAFLASQQAGKADDDDDGGGAAEGLSMLDAATQRLQKMLPKGHPLLARVRAGTAAALLRAAQALPPRRSERRAEPAMLQRCADLLQQALDAFGASLSEGHVCRAYVRELVADLAMHKGDYRSALDEVNTARVEREALTGDSMGAPGNSGQELRLQDTIVEITVRLSLPVPDETVERYYKTVQRCAATYGDSDPHMVPPLQNLAELHYQREEYGRAHHYLATALSVVDSQNMHFLLGNLFRPASQLKAAEVQERNRLAAERMAPPQCLLFGVILSQIAACYEAQRQLREAESSYMQTLAAFEIAQAPSHLGVCYALDGLARLLHHQGMHGDALSYFEKAAVLRSDAHPSLTQEQEESAHNIAVVGKQLSLLGYKLLRHEAPSKFPVYI